MLALKSSMTTAVNGVTPFSNTVIVCCLPLSNTVNWSFSRFGTRRPPASVTVVGSATNCVPALNVACCATSPATATTTSADVTTNPRILGA